MRAEGWEGRLNAVIDAARATPYALGTHDCFRVACATVHALTGVDRWAEWQGRYRSRREALALIAEHGRSFEAAASAFFGEPASDVRHARRGDLVCVQTEDGEKHLGVCLGINAAVLGPDGLAFVPTMTCLCCWRIG